ncbi:hypothetical protein [Thalassotalea atypica]|uniref:hypothetical protein n=1 Tax=Thalassotalea atypica TaxID=2054316 RepID=UPI0025730B45|nr:hypothetical protein [Thalassotalea atypica]
MSKSIKAILLLLAAFFLFVGFKSAFDTKSYEELTNVKTIKGVIYKLHCPQNGAAALSLEDSSDTYNLSIKFRVDYCNDDNAEKLLGKAVSIKAIPVNTGFYQVYDLKHENNVVLSPDEVAADRSNSTIGLFFLAFLLIALVVYKSRKGVKNNKAD